MVLASFRNASMANPLTRSKMLEDSGTSAGMSADTKNAYVGPELAMRSGGTG